MQEEQKQLGSNVDAIRITEQQMGLMTNWFIEAVQKHAKYPAGATIGAIKGKVISADNRTNECLLKGINFICMLKINQLPSNQFAEASVDVNGRVCNIKIFTEKLGTPRKWSDNGYLIFKND